MSHASKADGQGAVFSSIKGKADKIAGAIENGANPSGIILATLHFVAIMKCPESLAAALKVGTWSAVVLLQQELFVGGEKEAA